MVGQVMQQKPASPQTQSGPDAGQARPQHEVQGVRHGSANPDFPEPWAGFLKNVKSIPKVVFTYMELGLDLGGQPDSRRSAVLKHLMNHLKWPKGTTAFWPTTYLSNNFLEPAGQMFWKGWQLWKTPSIVCLGREALQIIYPQAEPGSTMYFLENVTIYVMPSMTELISMLPHEQQIAIDELLNIRI